MSTKRTVDNIANLITEDANELVERRMLYEDREGKIVVKGVPLVGGLRAEVEYHFTYDVFGSHEPASQFDPGDSPGVEIIDVQVENLMAYSGASGPVEPDSPMQHQEWTDAAIAYFDNQLVDQVSDRILQEKPDQPDHELDDSMPTDLERRNFASRLP